MEIELQNLENLPAKQRSPKALRTCSDTWNFWLSSPVFFLVSFFFFFFFTCRPVLLAVFQTWVKSKNVLCSRFIATAASYEAISARFISSQSRTTNHIIHSTVSIFFTSFTKAVPQHVLHSKALASLTRGQHQVDRNYCKCIFVHSFELSSSVFNAIYSLWWIQNLPRLCFPHHSKRPSQPWVQGWMNRCTFMFSFDCLNIVSSIC